MSSFSPLSAVSRSSDVRHSIVFVNRTEPWTAGFSGVAQEKGRFEVPAELTTELLLSSLILSFRYGYPCSLSISFVAHHFAPLQQLRPSKPLSQPGPLSPSLGPCVLLFFLRPLATRFWISTSWCSSDEWE